MEGFCLDCCRELSNGGGKKQQTVRNGHRKRPLPNTRAPSTTHSSLYPGSAAVRKVHGKTSPPWLEIGECNISFVVFVWRLPRATTQGTVPAAKRCEEKKIMFKLFHFHGCQQNLRKNPYGTTIVPHDGQQWSMMNEQSLLKRHVS